MARNEKFFEKTRQAAEKKCGEPVIGVGVLQPRGMLGLAGVTAIAPGAGFFGAKALAGATGLPQIGVYAVTNDEVRIFPASPRGFGVKLKDEVVRIPRSDIRVALAGGTMAPVVMMTHTPTNQVYELEGSAFGDVEAVQRFAAFFTT